MLIIMYTNIIMIVIVHRLYDKQSSSKLESDILLTNSSQGVNIVM